MGSQTRIGDNNLLSFNEPLVKAIAQQGTAAISSLAEFLEKPQQRLALLEGIYTAQKLVEQSPQALTDENRDRLYAAVSPYNTSPDPFVQIYLAGFYRALNNPATFGPVLSTLINQSIYRYAEQANPADNVTEELGGTLLQQIANRTAEETVKRLLPYLPPPGQRFSQ